MTARPEWRSVPKWLKRALAKCGMPYANTDPTRLVPWTNRVWVPEWIWRLVSFCDAACAYTEADYERLWRAIGPSPENHAAVEAALRLDADPYDVIRAYLNPTDGDRS